MTALSGQWAGVRPMGSGRAVARSVVASLVALGLLVASPAALVRADEQAIAITDAGFVPGEVTVSVGEPVTWTNAGTTEHWIVTADGELDSGPIGRGAAYGHVFESAGIFEYYDKGDPTVRGRIIVTAAPASEAPSGSSAPDPSPVAPSEVPASSTSPSAVASASAAPTPVVVTVQSGGNGSALLLAVAVVGAIAVAATIAGLIGASRRPDR